MKEMTAHERMQRMYEHRDAAVDDYFALDKFAWIFADNSPRYPVKVIGKTGEFVRLARELGRY
ncbi:MAG: hypothetical protein PHV34_12845 [Verrucomicrobiae bacterium]|nr:hypothetical protein [Verrucomicrobiae bacterium]